MRRRIRAAGWSKKIWVFAQFACLIGGALAFVPGACVSNQSGQKSQNPPQPELRDASVVLPVAAPLTFAPTPAPPPGASVTTEVVTTAPALLVKDAFAAPESVLHDPGADVYLVSNLNGAPNDADDNGFISRVSPDGKVIALKWIDGAHFEVELNAPRGMAIVADVLYVADIDRIRRFNVHSGAPLGAIVVSGASSLNDVSAAPDGTVFFTDLGARSLGDRLEPTGQDAVYKLVRDQARAVMRAKQLSQPNGVWADANAVWVVSFASNELFDVKSGSKARAQRIPAGMLGGIVRANDGRVFVSSWQSQQIFVGELGGTFQVAYEVSSPGDIGYDAKRNWLLIPMLRENALKLQPL